MNLSDYERLALASEAHRFAVLEEEAAKRVLDEAITRRAASYNGVREVLRDMCLEVPGWAPTVVAEFVTQHYRAGRAAQAHLTPPPPIVLSSDASLAHSTQLTPLEAPNHDN